MQVVGLEGEIQGIPICTDFGFRRTEFDLGKLNGIRPIEID